MKLIMLVGLPGSGKTWLGEKLSRKGDCLGFFDDISVNKEAFTAFKCLITRSQGRVDAISTQFPLRGTVIVADVNLCDPYQRGLAIKMIEELDPDVKFEWVYFENDPIKCRKNVERRDDGRVVEGTIQRFTKIYEIPDGVTPRGIWNAE